MRSRELPFGRAALHVADYGGSGGRTVLFVHGLGGSHANFTALAPLVAQGARVLAVDLPGFGLSEPGAGSHLQNLSSAVSALVDAVHGGAIEGASGPVILVGNSMGGALAILEASRRPERVASVALIAPALPQRNVLAMDPRFSLMLGAAMLPGYDALLRRRIGKAGPESMVHDMLSLCCVDRRRVPPEAVEAMVALARRRAKMAWLGTSFSEAARSLVATMFQRERFVRAMRAVRAPTLLVHGDRDRLVPVASAREAAAACPHWELEIYEGVGHVPQLEVPERLAASLEAFLARRSERAA